MQTTVLSQPKLSNRDISELKVRSGKAPLAIAIFLSICVTLMLAPPRWGSNSGLGSLIDKHKRLHTLGSPKLVIIGGSNAVTGIDSTKLEKKLHLSVVNMGLGASLGLRYMLEEVKDDIHAGDILVVTPEYDFFCVTSPAESNAQLNGTSDLIHVCQAFPEASQWVFRTYFSSPSRILNLIDHLRRFDSNKFASYRNAVGEALASKSLSPIFQVFTPRNSIYTQRKNYDERGDFTAHLGLHAPGYGPIEVLCYSKYEFNQEALAALREFSNFARQKGATVCVVPPPLPEPLMLKYADRAQDIVTHLQTLSSLQVVGTPQRYTFPAKYFFDTPYHLNAQGRQLRTQRLIEDLSTQN